MNIDELTIGQAKELANLIGCRWSTSHSFMVGKNYLIRTVTLHYVGRLVAVTDSDIVLKNASWVADTGRFADCLRTGELSEVEPFQNDCVVARAVIVDFTEWDHALPTEQK